MVRIRQGRARVKIKSSYYRPQLPQAPIELVDFLRGLLNISHQKSLDECSQPTRTLQDFSKTLKEKSRCLASGGRSYRTVFSLLRLRLLPNKHNDAIQISHEEYFARLPFLFFSRFHPQGKLLGPVQVYCQGKTKFNGLQVYLSNQSDTLSNLPVNGSSTNEFEEEFKTCTKLIKSLNKGRELPV